MISPARPKMISKNSYDISKLSETQNFQFYDTLARRNKLERSINIHIKNRHEAKLSFFMDRGVLVGSTPFTGIPYRQ